MLGDPAIDNSRTYEVRSANHDITKERAKVNAHSSCHVKGNPTIIVQTVMSTQGSTPPWADDVHPGGELCQDVPSGVEMALTCKKCVLCKAGGVRLCHI